jgi:hypothetical protein
LTVSSDATISGSLSVGSGPSSGLQIKGSLIVVNDAVNYNIMGKIDASSITSGTIESARLPPLQINLYTYNAPAPTTAPNWCRIMTITMSANRFTPLKSNILGSRPASGWPTYFDEDYYIQFRRDTTTAELSDTYYYYACRRINYPLGEMKLSFVRTSFQEMDVYIYRDHNYAMSGSVLFNKISTTIITTYTNEPVLTTAPDYASFCPMRFATVPTPPATGTYTLQSNNGVLSWG